MKLNATFALKILGLACSIAGMVIASFVGDRRTEETLEKLVDDRLDNQN